MRIQKQKVEVYIWYIAIICIIGYAVGSVLIRSYDVPRASILEADFASYATSSAQYVNRDLYASDTIFYDGIYLDVFLKNTPVYMLGLVFLDQLVDPIDYAFDLFNVFAYILLLTGMTTLLNELVVSRWVALAVAVFSSSVVSVLFTTSQHWGIVVDTPLIPSALYLAFSPWLAFVVYRYWWNAEAFKPSYIFLCGLFVGLLFSLVHGIGMASLQLIVALSLYLWWRGKISFSSLIWFGVGGVLGMLPRFRPTNGSGIASETFSWESASATLNHSMVFPWANVRSIALASEDFIDLRPLGYQVYADGRIELIFLIIYLFLSLFAIFMIWRSGKGWGFFLSLQAIYQIILLNIGGIPLIIAAYFWRRIRNNSFSVTDEVLLTGLFVTGLLGPLQQVVGYYVITTFEIASLTGVVFEIFRFSILIYLFLYIALARAIEQKTIPVPSLFWRIVIIAVILFATYISLAGMFLYNIHLDGIAAFALCIALAFWQPKQPIVLPSWHLVTVAGLISVLGVQFYLSSRGAESITLLVATLLTCATVAWLVFQPRLRMALLLVPIFWYAFLPNVYIKNNSGFELKYREFSQLERNEFDNYSIEKYNLDVTPEFLEMTEWVKAETPIDSLFHLVTRNRAFRYYAERSLLTGLGDWSYGVYVNQNNLLEMEQEFSTYVSPWNSVVLAQKYATDYLILTGRDSQSNPGELFPGDLVFRNAEYAIYDLGMMAVSDLPQPSSIYEGQIFNPARYSLANREIDIGLLNLIISALSDDELVSDLSNLLEVFVEMQYETEMSLTDAQVLAISDWRQTRSPDYLRAAGIKYLFVGREWVGYLPQEAYDQLNADYILVKEWALPEIRQHYYLYEVPQRDVND